MANIAAIEKAVMTADEKTLKEMAGNIGMEIFGRLSPEARGRLAEHIKTETVTSGRIVSHRKLTEKERDRMIDVIASGPLTYRPAIDDELFKLGLIEWYDRDPKTNAVDYSGKPFYANNGRILPEWYEFKTQTKRTSVAAMAV